MQIKTDQFAEAARAALHDTYTRTFLDGMHAKVKARLKSMVSEEIGLSVPYSMKQKPVSPGLTLRRQNPDNCQVWVMMLELSSFFIKYVADHI